MSEILYVKCLSNKNSINCYQRGYCIKLLHCITRNRLRRAAKTVIYMYIYICIYDILGQFCV